MNLYKIINLSYINKSEKLTYLVNSLKAKKTNIVDIKAIEISHNVKNV